VNPIVGLFQAVIQAACVQQIIVRRDKRTPRMTGSEGSERATITVYKRDLIL